MIMVGALIGSDAVPLSLDEINEAVRALSVGTALKKNLAALSRGFEFILSRKNKPGSTQVC